MSAESGEERGDCFQLWRDDAGAILRLRDAERHEFTDALLAWFVNGETCPLSNQILDWFLAELTRKQTAAAKRHSELKARRAEAGRAGMKKRWGDKRITTDNNVMNENENENENLNQTERNETRTPQAATVSPPSLSNAVTVSSIPAHGAPDAIDAAIVDAAQRLGDGLPSRGKWRKFMLAHGVTAFRQIVAEVADTANVAKKGAYLNTRLDAYVEPAPETPKPRQERTFTPRDWGLCRERCANFNAETATCPYSRIPPEHAANPHPPEECPHFKRCADYGENTPRIDFSALAAGIGNPLPRTVREGV